jgi:hypothetical protein
MEFIKAVPNIVGKQTSFGKPQAANLCWLGLVTFKRETFSSGANQ